MATADPRKQALFEQASKQAAKMLTSEKAATAIARDAKARGPAAAIVEALKQAVQVMTAAAGKSGIQIPPDVAMAAALAVAQVLVTLMVKAGLADDPKALYQEVEAGLQGAMQQRAPAKPTTAPQPRGMLSAVGGA